MKKLIFVLLALNIVGALIAGCGPKAEEAPAGDAGAATTEEAK